MFNFIKKYLQNVKKEMKRDYVFADDDGVSASPNKWDYENTEPLEYSMTPWIGVDLDGTLAYYEPGKGIDFIGPPVPAMAEFVRKMVKNQVRVKIFTARACDPEQLPLIEEWLLENGFPAFEITNMKDYQMIRLYDDRSIQVEHNTGRLIRDDTPKD